jgi:hypothetical protein
MGDALLYVGFQSKVNSCYLDELEDAKEKKALSKVLLRNERLLVTLIDRFSSVAS